MVLLETIKFLEILGLEFQEILFLDSTNHKNTLVHSENQDNLIN